MSTLRPTTFIGRVLLNIVTRKTAKGREPIKVGTDYLGNEYFEQPEAGPHLRRIGESKTVFRGKRWYYPKGEDDWDEAIPPEWEAWLRYRRLEQPTDEEILLNMAVAHVKKVNAKKLQELEAGQVKLNEGDTEAMVKTGEPVEDPNKYPAHFKQYPSYDDYYEVNPGAVTKERYFGKRSLQKSPKDNKVDGSEQKEVT